jgi:hypothetical protein
MSPGQAIVVRVAPNEQGYVWWVVDLGYTIPTQHVPTQAQANYDTSSSNIGTAVAAALPTVGD